MLSSKFNRDVIFLSPMTVLEAKADVDGDLVVCFVLDEYGQKLLHTFKDLDLKICKEEKNWISNYIKGEYESNADLVLDWKTKCDTRNKPLDFKYKIYTMPVKYNMAGNKHIETYAQYLINAGIAKSNVGPSTIDCWLIKSIFQCYEALFKEFGGVSIAKNSGETIKMVKPFSEELRTKLEFTYVRLVQERVVEGIKHMAGGSSSFKIYYLQNITEKSNEKLIKKQLTEEYDLTAHEVERFLSILSFVKSYRGLLSASTAFIKKYNKGTLPTSKDTISALELNEEYLMLHTYFGSLVKDLYDISQEVKDLKDVSTTELKQGHKENSDNSIDTFNLTDIL